MKTIRKNVSIAIVLASFFLGCFLASPFAFAKSPSDFAKPYGLIVHQLNQDAPVMRDKAVQVLSKAFGTKITVDKNTDGKAPLPWKEFLVLFSTASGQTMSTKMGFDEIYLKTWTHARNMNYLPIGELTYSNLQEFLYRYKVSDVFKYPYYDGLVLSADEINIRQFSDPYAIPKIIERLNNHLIPLRKSDRTSDKALVKKLEGYRERFKELEVKIAEARHPFHVFPDLDVAIREKVAALDLKEVLGEIHYDYSKNDKNRQYNLVVGLMKMNGRVLDPGDTLDFLKTLSSKNWWDYKFGWVLIEGKSAWSFGGGLCGAATMTFTAAWRAGFEVIERHPHSTYFHSLYPEESLGADAAIFRSSKNMKIKNNSTSPILFYVKDEPEAKKISLYIMGNPAYKKITLDGPISTKKNNYEWKRQMEGFDGTITTDTLTTRYYGVQH